jgi:hypothetical protein
MVGVILKAIFFYFAFIFIRSLIRGFFNYKILKAEVKRQQASYGQSNTTSTTKKEHDFSKSKGDIIEAEFKVID